MVLLRKRLRSTPASVREEFASFEREWQAFRTQYWDWSDRASLWSGAWDKLQAYKIRTNVWIKRAAKLGVMSKEEAMPIAASFSWSGLTWAIALLVGLVIVTRTKER